LVLAEAERFVRLWRSTTSPDKQPEKGKEPVLVLTRTRKSKADIEARLRRLGPDVRRGCRVLTYHTSKGLEAPYCVLVGDCAYDGRSPFRNLAYQLAGCQESYDTAQRDEALRLAYVAVTRAAKECTWFAEPVA